MVGDIEELEEMDAHLNSTQRSGNFICPVADGTIKYFGENSV